MTDGLSTGRRVLASQPFSALMGVTLEHFGTSGAELRLDLTEQHLQHHGFVHGGVLSFMADLALTFADGADLGSDALTSEFTINDLRPGRGEVLVARATVLHAGRTQAVVRCDVFCLEGQSETRCAAAQGTIVRRAGP